MSKFSIRGTFPIADGSPVVAEINKYVLWRLVTGQIDAFTFEAWVNTSNDKTALFNDLKPFVDAYGGSIDWHECTHDEPDPRPCEIEETYEG